MPNKYVRSTDGLNSDDGSTWLLGKATVGGAASAAAPGESIYVSQVHAETTAAGVTISFPGTILNPNIVLCANDASDPPTSTNITATVSTTGASNLSVSGSAFIKGLALKCSDGANYAQMFINTTSANQTWQDCTFEMGGSHSSCNMQIGNNSGSLSKTKLVNHKFKILSTSQPIQLGGIVEINGATFSSGCATPASGVFQAFFAGAICKLNASGVDFSNLASNVNLCWTPGTSNSFQAVFRNCKLPAGWSGALFGGANAVHCARAEMHNCDAGATTYKLWIEDWAGSIKSETTVVMTGGSSDGVTNYSWKMTSSANARYPAIPLVTCDLPAVLNSAVGVSKTITVEVLHDSVTPLTNDEIWLEVEYLGSTGAPLAYFASNMKADILAAPSNQPTSSATWTTTGLTTPNKQSLSVTVIPQLVGFIQARVCLAKPSKVVFVSAKQTVV